MITPLLMIFISRVFFLETIFNVPRYRRSKRWTCLTTTSQDGQLVCPFVETAFRQPGGLFPRPTLPLSQIHLSPYTYSLVFSDSPLRGAHFRDVVVQPIVLSG